jgi:hypothetical protein
MKTILVMLVLGAAAYYFYVHLHGRAEDQGSKDITNPVYLEVRLEMPVQGRQLEFVLFGKMADDDDCRNRADRAWGKIIDGCVACTKKISSCLASLEPRYLRLFDNAPINTAYLSFTSDQAGERDGRMVFWGVTAAEGNAVCEAAKGEFSKNYKGAVSCVLGTAQ